jgi:hypothetical protein
MIVHAQTKFTMKTVIEKSAAEAPPLRTATAKAPDIAAASVPDTLATLNVNPDKHPRKRHTAILVGNWIQQRGLSTPRHQNHARFSVERKELFGTLGHLGEISQPCALPRRHPGYSECGACFKHET